MYSKLNQYFTTRKFSSSLVLNLTLLLATPLFTIILMTTFESKFNSGVLKSKDGSANGSYELLQASLVNPGQAMNDLSLQNLMPNISDFNLERINHSLVKKDLRISHQKNKIVKLESISLILCGLTLISVFTAALMFRKHHRLITGLKKHGLPLLKDSPEMTTELLLSHAPKTESCLSQHEMNKMLVTALLEAVNIWITINDQSLVEFAYQSKIWTITNDSGTLRVRSLERYLSIDKIPKNPRWKNVTKSIQYVLSTLDNEDYRYLKLNEISEDLTLKLEKFYG